MRERGHLDCIKRYKKPHLISTLANEENGIGDDVVVDTSLSRAERRRQLDADCVEGTECAGKVRKSAGYLGVLKKLPILEHF